MSDKPWRCAVFSTMLRVTISLWMVLRADGFQGFASLPPPDKATSFARARLRSLVLLRHSWPFRLGVAVPRPAAGAAVKMDLVSQYAMPLHGLSLECAKLCEFCAIQFQYIIR